MSATNGRSSRSSEGSSSNTISAAAGRGDAPSRHHHCTVTAPSLHHHCTITAPLGLLWRELPVTGEQSLVGAYAAEKVTLMVQ